MVIKHIVCLDKMHCRWGDLPGCRQLIMVSALEAHDHSWCKDIHSTGEWQQVSNYGKYNILFIHFSLA